MSNAKKTKAVIAGALVIGSLLGGGAYWWFEARHYETTDNAYIHSEITRLSPKVSGYVAHVDVQDNQNVKAGDILLRLDTRDYDATAREAEAAVKVAEANLEIVQAQLKMQEAVIQSARSQVDAAIVERDHSIQDFERSKDLVKRSAASRRTFDDDQANVRRSRADLDNARASLLAAQRKLDVLRAQEHQAEAEVSRARASAELANLNLENTIIRTPIDGVVGNRSVRQGQFVGVGTPLLAIVPIKNVWIEANFKETQIEKMQQGQTVSLHVDAYPGVEISGQIESIAPASGAQFSLLPPENASGNFTKIVQRIPVRIQVPTVTQDALLLPGMSVEVAVDTRSETGEDLARHKDNPGDNLAYAH